MDDELRLLFTELVDRLTPCRPGWKHTNLDALQLGFILDREAIIEMCLRVNRIQWQSINAHDRELSEKIKHSAMHALSVMLAAMRSNEDKML